MAYENILLDVSPEGTAVLTLNRPQKRNAFNAEVIAELTDAFETLSKNPECRLVLIRGNGPVFSAGADLEWMKAASHYTAHENEEDAYGMAEMLRRLYELPQVTIALLHGAAMAGACGVAAACDIAIAKKGTIFSFSEVKLGIIPATISPYIINAIGPRWARTLFVTAERFEADVAEKIRPHPSRGRGRCRNGKAGRALCRSRLRRIARRHRRHQGAGLATSPAKSSTPASAR